MPFEIGLTAGAQQELKAIRAFDRRRIIDEIEVQLAHEPTKETRNRKCLKTLLPGLEHVEALWELRVGDHRVFYDVDQENQKVKVQAVREKKPHQTTED